MAKVKDKLQHRLEQREALLAWLASDKPYYLQVNFCVHGSADHQCVNICHAEAEGLRQSILDALDNQIDYLTKKSHEEA